MLAIYMSKLVSLEPIIVGAYFVFGQNVQQVPQINEHVTRLLWQAEGGRDRRAGMQADRGANRQAERRETEVETGRQTHRQTEIQTDRRIDIQTDIQTAR